MGEKMRMRKHLLKKLIGLALIITGAIILFCAIMIDVQARTWTVDDDGGGRFHRDTGCD